MSQAYQFIRITDYEFERTWERVRSLPKRLPYELEDVIQSFSTNLDEYGDIDMALITHMVRYIHEIVLQEIEVYSIDAVRNMYQYVVFGLMDSICVGTGDVLRKLYATQPQTLSSLGCAVYFTAQSLHDTLPDEPGPLSRFKNAMQLMIEVGKSLCVMLVDNDQPSSLFDHQELEPLVKTIEYGDITVH